MVSSEKEVRFELDTSRVGLMLPTYDMMSANRLACVNFGRQFRASPMFEVSSSALGHCFNMAYQAMRRLVDDGKLDYAIMLHADVVPLQMDWGSILMGEMLKTQADILSVIVPIKNDVGVTSTALMTQEVEDKKGWHPIRFTMHEVMQLPETFTHKNLYLNTGLMVIDMRKEWAKSLVFDLESYVNLKEYSSWFVPEDWKMSRYASLHGGKLYATRKVHVHHVGSTRYTNTEAWGNVQSEGAMELYLKEGE